MEHGQRETPPLVTVDWRRTADARGAEALAEILFGKPESEAMQNADRVA